MKTVYLSLVALFLLTPVIAQQPATNAMQIEKSLQQKATLTENSLVKNLPFTRDGKDKIKLPICRFFQDKSLIFYLFPGPMCTRTYMSRHAIEKKYCCIMELYKGCCD